MRRKVTKKSVDEQIVNQIKAIKRALMIEKRFDGILSHPSATKLSEIDVNESTKELILDELEDMFDIEIRGTDREEIITVQDILTAVYLQKHKL